MGDVNETLEAAANATNATKIAPEDSMLAYASLYGMALFCIYVGSLRSVAFVRHSRNKGEKIENSITWRDAKFFPLTASAVLFSLYVLFKYNDEVHAGIQTVLGKVMRQGGGNETAASESRMPRLSKENLGFILLLLLCYEGCFALAHLLKPLVSRLLHSLPLSSGSELVQNLPYELQFTRSKSKGSHEKETLVQWEFDTHDVVSVLLCSTVAVAHIWRRHWITNNIIGVSFSLYGIEALHLCSFRAGAMLLAGLFVYDVFWVFATDVMSTVATSVQAPILLMFPQDLRLNGWAANKFAMLGLGDIVIPGIFLALLLRFGENDEARNRDPAAPTRRIYFYATLGAYAAGLILTIAVMHWFKAAQPALLYLVPACVGAPSLLALVRGQVQELFGFSEHHLIKDDKKKEADEEKEKKSN